ncbi:MAG TPA: molybdopterin molybdotransferase MoeA, partial [Planctomycetaceae bacterium]|nr:molybdopterin molybdotransferase MoeA [Planctomycetaceae bacterium]
MLAVEDALGIIHDAVEPLPARTVPLEQALGLVLAERVVSDIDSPPFDKSSMDGFAVRTEDVAGGSARLRLVGEVAAGRVSDRSVGPGESIQIMTGAALPPGADAVVPVEESRIEETSEGRFVLLEPTEPVCFGLNVIRRGASIGRGETVLEAGRRLRPQELGALAEMGRAHVAVHRRPRVAILATGDELVPIDVTPGPGQIRNSNEMMLIAQVRRAGGEPISLGVARDEHADLRRHITEGLRYDVLLLSGGVSAGKLDLVPAQLEAAGVRSVFHKVRLRPGKPLWFGVREAAPHGRC